MNKTQLTQAISQKRKEANAADEAARELHCEVRRLEIQLTELTYHVTFGSLVENTDGVFRVCQITPSNSIKWPPMMRGFKQRKDGTFGTRPKFIREEWWILDSESALSAGLKSR